MCLAPVPFTEVVDAGSLELVRARVREFGERAGLTDLALTKFVLAVHELAVNAVRHAGGRGEVRVWADAGGLRCAVTDHGRGIARRYLDVRRPASATEIRGWGLWLVHQICADVRVETGSAGTRVTIRYPVPVDG
jgi:anti-sigma regulatory factor (Ser/Thr protein kinase)